jgi:decaprenyl-phosphate phosphoribosyltransferase
VADTDLTVADTEAAIGADINAAIDTDAGTGLDASPAADLAPLPAERGIRAPGRLLGGLVKTARPRQWIKNLLVVAAPAAAGQLGSRTVLERLPIVLVLFTFASAATYLLNDVLDVEADRAHPEKRRRPIASGRVPVPAAVVAAVVLAAAAIAGSLVLCNWATSLVIGTYLVIQFAYCTKLKHVLVVDLAVVASGFLLRALVGGLAVDIPISRWFLITTGFGALFMVSAKRYSELVLMEEHGGKSRALLTSYTQGYLRFVWQLSAGAALFGYCLWALGDATAAGGAPLVGVSPHQGVLPWRELSVIPFVVGLLRYAVFADRGTAGAPEDVVLGDKSLMVIGLLWAVVYGCAVIKL